MNRLSDVDVTGVHLVDSPANLRRFALVKAAGGPSPVRCPNGDYTGPMTDDGDCPTCGAALPTTKSQGAPVKTIKLADLKKALEAQTGEDIDATAFLKALGIELPAEKTDNTDPAPTPIDKSKLPPEVAATLTAMEKVLKQQNTAIEALTEANTARARTELRKRAEILQAAGLEIDVEKATDVEITAMEKVWKDVGTRLEKVGIFKALGSPDRTESSGTPLKDAIQNAVREHLGREPLDKMEEQRTKQAIYKSHPGLRQAVLNEERAARRVS